MMRTEQAKRHIRIGAALGFPMCCIAAWIEDPGCAALRRGVITVRRRSHAEAQRLAEELSMPGIVRDPFMRYVPCPLCMFGPGWTPLGAAECA